jgi:hypothetical protein
MNMSLFKPAAIAVTAILTFFIIIEVAMGTQVYPTCAFSMC